MQPHKRERLLLGRWSGVGQQWQERGYQVTADGCRESGKFRFRNPLTYRLCLLHILTLDLDTLGTG